MTPILAMGNAFVREQVRDRVTFVALRLLPAVFVWTAASVLGQFAAALGGALAGSAAGTLSAGWSAAFLAGALGFFQTSAARGADRRLALAGLGAVRVALSRVGASLSLALLVSGIAFGTLALRQNIPHPAHAAVAIIAFSLIYVAVGTLVGSIVIGALEGSLAVAFIFLFDVFSGPGMSNRDPGPFVILQPSRPAARVLMDAGGAVSSTASD